MVGGADITLLEVEQAASVLTRRAQPEANVIIGASINPALRDEIRITVVATGFGATVLSQGDNDKASDASSQRRVPSLSPAFTPH